MITTADLLREVKRLNAEATWIAGNASKIPWAMLSQIHSSVPPLLLAPPWGAWWPLPHIRVFSGPPATSATDTDTPRGVRVSVASGTAARGFECVGQLRDHRTYLCKHGPRYLRCVARYPRSLGV